MSEILECLFFGVEWIGKRNEVIVVLMLKVKVLVKVNGMVTVM